MSRDRNGQTESAKPKRLGPKRPDRKVLFRCITQASWQQNRKQLIVLFNFHTLPLIRNKPSGFFLTTSLKLSAHFLAHSEQLIDQSRAQIVQGVQTVPMPNEVESQSVNCTFRKMWKNTWFNIKITRVGEITPRSTRQPTFKKNKKKVNQRDYVYRKEMEKEKYTHTKVKNNPKHMYNRSSAKKTHKYRTATNSVTSSELITNKEGFACFEWSKCVHNAGNQIYMSKRSCLYNFINVWYDLFKKSLGISFHSLKPLQTEWRCCLTVLYKRIISTLLFSYLYEICDILMCIHVHLWFLWYHLMTYLIHVFSQFVFMFL